MSVFHYLALGCAVAAGIASVQHVDSRFLAVTWALLAVAASVLAAGGA